MKRQAIAVDQKAHGHPAYLLDAIFCYATYDLQKASANMPAKAAPVRNPHGPQAPKIPMTSARLSPGGNERPMSAMPFGTKSAGPIPCSPRQTHKAIYPQLYAKPHKNDMRASHMKPAMKILLCPNISPNLPAGTMKVPSDMLYEAVSQASSPG
jgi:hypothetical protein